MKHSQGPEDALSSKLREKVPPQEYETWFQNLSIEAVAGERVTLRAPSQFVRDWIEDHYQELVRSSVAEALGRPARVHILAGSVPSAQDAHEAPAKKPAPTTGGLFNPRYVFDSFVVGPSNRLSHAAALAVVDSPASAYNPLFIHGGVGLGKTHLLHAICHATTQKNPSSRVVYLSCEAFVNRLVSAISEGALSEFRDRFATADLLVVDDIHFLAGKERSQEEFFHVFNALVSAQKQIVLASDSAPQEIKGLQERLVSRFVWGLITKVESPSYETRLALVQAKSLQRGSVLPPAVAEYIAMHIEGSVRELEGAITRVTGVASLDGKPVSLDLAKDALRDLIGLRNKPVRIEDICGALVSQFGVSLSDLQSKRRSKSVAFPRQVGMFLARRLTSMSFEEIGRHFGGKDHSTVMYAISKIEKKLGTDQNLQLCVELLTKNLQQP